MRDARYIRSDQEIKVPVHLNFGKFILDKIRVKNNEIALVCIYTNLSNLF